MNNMFGSNGASYFFLIIIFILTIGIAIVNYYTRIKEHLLRRDEYIKSITELFPLDTDKKLLHFFTIYTGRQLDYIRVYFIFQSIGKSSDGLSLIFSIATLAIVMTQKEVSWPSTIISILAITFVIVSIYVAPIKRAKQYLEAWRECDKNIMIFFSADMDKREVVCDGKIMGLDAFVSHCIRSLSNGEKNITTDEE